MFPIGNKECIVDIVDVDLFQISAEFAKILLHLTDLGGLDNCAHLRRKSMCALLVTCPVQVSLCCHGDDMFATFLLCIY